VSENTYFFFNIISATTTVSTTARLRAGKSRNRGSIRNKGKGFFSSPQYPEPLWGPQSILDTGALSPVEKRPARLTDYSSLILCFV
jgi:hypothetical protein